MPERENDLTHPLMGEGEGEGEGTLYCRRCDGEVRAIRPWRGWKPAWAVWKVGFVGALSLFPLLASDYCVMLPSMMLYIAAAGPLRSFARQPPVCGRCSLELEEGANARAVAPPRSSG